MDTFDTPAEGEAIRYHVVIAGHVPAEWIGWFEADSLTPAWENTVLEVRVTDQAELYGRLRRIHDLHLKLISITPCDPNRSDFHD